MQLAGLPPGDSLMERSFSLCSDGPEPPLDPGASYLVFRVKPWTLGAWIPLQNFPLLLLMLLNWRFREVYKSIS